MNTRMLAHKIHGSERQFLLLPSVFFKTIIRWPWGDKNISELTLDFNLTFPQDTF